MAISAKVAIYVIFPKTDVLESHKVALKYFSENGYSPVVVSNTPLKRKDRQDLLSLSSLVIERPNYGYDFGAYRDGILAVTERFPAMEHLALFNDSVWFPLPDSMNWLTEAEALGKDYVGAASNYGLIRPKPEEFANFRLNYSTDRYNFHYCSFALLLSGRVIRSREFQKFWKRYPLTNDKKWTVKFGEIGLSKFIIRSGYTHATTTDLVEIHSYMQSLSDEELRELVWQTVIPEKPKLKAVRHRLSREHLSRDEAISFVLTSFALQGMAYAHPQLLHQCQGYSFLKKSPLWLDGEAAEATLLFIDRLDDPFGAIMREEADMLRALAT